MRSKCKLKNPEIKPFQKHSLKKQKKINHLVFWPSFILIISALLLSVLNKDKFVETMLTSNDWILQHFDWLFTYTSITMVVLCVIILFSPIVRMKIGGDAAVPILSRWRWFSIIICTTIAVGILFWGSSEPLYHISSPPSGVSTDEAFATSSVFVHWSFTPYAIYTIPALLFALGFYNHKSTYSLGTMLFPIIENRNSWIIKVVDAICLFALVAGMSAVMGVGMLTIAGGFSETLAADKPILLLLIGIALVASFTISAATGLLKGIRILSSINITLFFILCAAVILFGPSKFIAHNLFAGLKTMAINFVPQNLGIGKFSDKPWMHAWTTFYWANWMAWAPITALFLGRISYGYTVREFMLFNWIVPSVFGIIWISVFSGSSLYINKEVHDLVGVLNASGPDSIIYEIYNYLPYTKVFIAVFLITVFLSYVTAADSNTEAMASICTEGLSAESSNPPTYLKFIWGVLIGCVGWVMVSFAGVDGVKMLSNIGGLPSLFLMVSLCIATIVYLIRQSGNQT